jgi:UDP-hydrolysing UDP-N-acetyl-D-glucosamine 2-epimerase
MKTILVVTGSRAEYGLLRPVFQAIDDHPELILQVAVTGTHLEKRFGYTVDEVKKEWPVDVEVPLSLADDKTSDMARAISRATAGFADVVDRLSPDLMLVLGDRFEILGAAMGGVYSGIFLGHIHGGDSPQAGMDEYARHAITKLSHLHFAVSPRSAERIRKMGENPEQVHIVGAPGLDSILHQPLPSEEDLRERYDLGDRPLALLVQHPLSTNPSSAHKEMQITLDAVEGLEIDVVTIFPNSDAGGSAMIELLENMAPHEGFSIRQSLPHTDFLGLMKIAWVMIGNSSSGVLEAPSLKLPVVNIGSRQSGRERADNIIDVPHDTAAIRAAIQTALFDAAFQKRVQECVSPYGDGHAGEKIADILAETQLHEELRRKQLTY